MQLELTKNRILKSDSCRIGYCKENNSECLNIQIEDETLHNKRAYIEFQVNDGNTYTTDALEVVNGVVSYRVPNGLVSEAGFLYMQVVLRDDENNVIKSNVIMFTIDKAINAEDDLVLEYPDLISKIEKTIKDAEIHQEEINTLKADKMELIDLSSYKTGDTLPSDVADKIRNLREKAVLNLYWSGNYYLAPLEKVQTDNLFVYSSHTYDLWYLKLYKCTLTLNTQNKITINLYYQEVVSNNELTDLGNAKQDTLISGENIKTINEESLLGSGNIDLKGIIDVEELPDKWIGTPVPAGEYVDKIYFNTNLSYEEIESIINESNVYNSTYDYKIFRSNSGTEIQIIKLANKYTINYNGLNYIDSLGNWQTNSSIYKNPQEIKLTGVSRDNGRDVGHLNHLISSLVSITPFKQPDSNSIYRLPDGTLWMYHNDEWKELGGSNDVDNKLQNKQDILVSGENIKTINHESLLGNGNIELHGIVDVEKLPVKWIGTPVPLNGYVEKVYFNTNLSSKEIDELIEIARYEFEDDSRYFIASGISGSEPTIKTIEIRSDMGICYINENYSVEVIYNGNGWKQSEIFVRGEVNKGSTINRNHLISSLVSITPFEKDMTPSDKNSIYRLPDGTLWVYHNDEWVELATKNNIRIIDVDELPNEYGWKGTPVPNSGYVDKIYFNTNLSKEDVNRLMNLLTPNFGQSYVVFSDNDSNYFVTVDKRYTSIGDIDWGVGFYNEGEWLPDAYEPHLVESNAHITDTNYGVEHIGEQNHLISSLVSITPFEKVDIDTNAIYRLPDGSLWKYQVGWKPFISENNAIAIQSSNIKLNMLKYDPSNNWSWNGICTVSIPINDTLRNLLDEGKLRLQLVKLNKRGRKKGTGIRGWSFPKIPFGVGSLTFNNERSNDSYGVGKDYPENSINPFIELDSSNISENGKYIVSNPIDVREIARCMCYYQHQSQLVSAELDTDHTQRVVRPTSDIDHDDNSYNFRIVGSDHRDNYKSSVIRFRIALTHTDDYNVYSMSDSIIKIRYVPHNPDYNPDKPLFLISTLIE